MSEKYLSGMEYFSLQFGYISSEEDLQKALDILEKKIQACKGDFFLMYGFVKQKEDLVTFKERKYGPKQ